MWLLSLKSTNPVAVFDDYISQRRVRRDETIVPIDLHPNRDWLRAT